MASDGETLGLEKFFSYIGEVCALWAEIDFYLSEILHQMAQCYSKLPSGDHRAFPTFILIRNMDMGQKTAAATALALHLTGDDEFYDDLKALMDEIGHDLRTTRNRLIHDDWVVTEDGVSQIQYISKVVKPQARIKALKLHSETTHRDYSQIESSVNRFYVALSNLQFLIERSKTLQAPPEETAQ